MLVIEDDEWVSRLLSNAIRDAGYDVITSATAKEGLEMACSEEPSCIICDVELPDDDGFWVARSIRALPTRVSATPFIFLTGLDDPQSRMEGYQVGADIYITKPFRIQEVVAQIDALVQMAERMRRQLDTQERARVPPPLPPDAPGEITGLLNELVEAPGPTTHSARAMREAREAKPKSEPVTAIEGDLSQMSIATVLTVLEMERRTGIFEVVSKKRRAQLEIAGGAVVQGMVGGTRVSALTTLRTMLGWTVGRFSFAPLPTREPPTTRKSISAFLLEATRLEDEAMRDELEMLPPSRRAPGQRLSAPMLGGPPSVDDLAPMSSRMSMPVPSSTQPARPPADDGFGVPSPMQRAAPQQPPKAAAAPPPPAPPARRPSEFPPPLPKTISEPVPPPPLTLEPEELEPISAMPTGGTPLFPGLANITGTHRYKPLTSQHTPPKPPPPPPPIKPTTSASHAPPPLPKRDSVSPGKPPPPPAGTAPRRDLSVNVPGPPPLPKAASKPATPPPPPPARPAVPPPPPRPEPQKKR